MLYTSSSLSLACLEILVHIREPRLPLNYSWVEIEIPESLIEAADLSSLSINNVDLCTEFGSRWLEASTSAALQVPSVIIPRDTNLLLNTKHPDFNKCKFNAPQTFSFDPRLIKAGPVKVEEYSEKN